MKKLFLISFLIITLQFQLKSASIPIDSIIAQSERILSKGKYNEGLQLSLKALKQAELNGTIREKASAHIQVSKMLYLNKQPKKEIFKQCYAAIHLIEKENIKHLKSLVYNNTGILFTEEKKYDSALFYFNKAILSSNEMKDYAGTSKTYALMAGICFEQSNESNACLDYLDKSENYAKKAKSPIEFARARTKRGIHYMAIGNYSKAIIYFKEVKRIHDSLKNTEGRIYVYQLLALASAGRYDENLKKDFESYIRLKDSVFTKQSADEIARYKISYETEKKETENKILQQENSLKQARITRITNILLILIVIVLLIIVIVGWRFYKINLKRKEAELIYSQKIQKERDRLARDLHDNTGSHISFVSSKIDWILKNRTINPELKNDLDSIKLNSVGIMEGLRETLWTLNSKLISNLELADRLKPYIKNHLLIPYDIEDDIENEKQMEPELVFNVYRCCQEIITNINKHSGANHVLIKFYDDPTTRLYIYIYDNGKGISETDLNKVNHYGLRNIKARLQEVEAKFEISSPSSGGTLIKLTLN